MKDDAIQPLCVNLGRFKRLKKISLVRQGHVRGGGEVDVLRACV